MGRKGLLRKSKIGFSLVEMLIVLILLGVLALLMIPTLKNSKNKEFQFEFKNAVALLQLANKMPVETTTDRLFTPYSTCDACDVKYDCRNKWTNQEVAEYAEKYIKPNLKIVKDCGEKGGLECFAKGNYKTISGNKFDNIEESGMSKILLLNGYSLAFGATDKDFSKGFCALNIYVDVNGVNPPNTKCRDLFVFAIYPQIDDGVYPSMTYKDGVLNKYLAENQDREIINKAIANKGDYCELKIIYDGYRMKY